MSATKTREGLIDNVMTLCNSLGTMNDFCVRN